MTTVGDLVDRVHAQLDLRGASTMPASSIGAADTTINLVDTENISKGILLGINDELLRVSSFTAGTTQVGVVRGQYGTTAAAYTTAAVVEVGWRFLSPLIVMAMKEELQSWPDTVFNIQTEDITIDTTTYQGTFADSDLDSELYRVLEVWRVRTRDGRRVEVPRWQYDRDPAGAAHYISTVGDVDGTVTLHLGCGWVYDNWGSDLDLEATALVPARLHDALVWGTAARMLESDEAKRSDLSAQPEPRHAKDVRIGDRGRQANLKRSLRNARLAEEAFRLLNRYPIKNF